MRSMILLAPALIMTGCATAPQTLWIRTDGQRTANNPVYQQDFQIARTVCLGEREKAALSGVTVSGGGLAGVVAAQQRGQAADQVAQGCMAEKGYVLVPADQAEAKLQDFAAVDAERKRQQATQGPALASAPATAHR